MTTTERLLKSGLDEARADLEFIRAHTLDDDALKLVIDSAVDLADLYLRAAEGAAKNA